MTTGRDPSPRQQQNGKAGKGSPSTGRQGGARAERAHRPPTGGDPEPLELDATRVAAVLFDLDGTLLELDMDQFLPVYLRRLTTPWLKPIQIRWPFAFTRPASVQSSMSAPRIAANPPISVSASDARSKQPPAAAALRVPGAFASANG